LEPQLRRALRLPEVEAAGGLRRTQIAEKVKAGTFPRPVRVSERRTVWWADEVATWQLEQTAAADRAQAAKHGADTDWKAK